MNRQRSESHHDAVVDNLQAVRRWIGRQGMVLLACVCVAQPTTTNAQNNFDLSELGYDGFAEAADDILIAAYEAGRIEELSVKVGDRVKVGQVLAVLDQQTQKLAADAARGLAEMSRARHLAAKEEINQREFEYARANEQLRRRQVVSTVEGVVAKVFVEVGEYVLPSDLNVARIINTSTLKVVFNLPAGEAERMSLGESLGMTFTSSGRDTTGTAELIAPLIDGESGTIAVTFRVDNYKGLFTAGDRCVLDYNRTKTNPVTARSSQMTAPTTAAIPQRSSATSPHARQGRSQ